MPTVDTHDVFEQEYTAKLRALLAPYGQLVGYESDRAALDLGLYLYEQPIVGDARVGQVRSGSKRRVFATPRCLPNE